MSLLHTSPEALIKALSVPNDPKHFQKSGVAYNYRLCENYRRALLVAVEALDEANRDASYDPSSTQRYATIRSGTEKAIQAVIEEIRKY